MNSRELFSEYAAALRNTEFADLAPLIAAGIGGRAISMLLPALDRVVIVDRANYRPDPDGGVVYVIPVRAEHPSTPESRDADVAVADGGLIDLLAFHPSHPQRWSLRLGNAEWLGAVAPQFMGPGRVPVWRSPLAWLRAECRGIVLLTTDRPALYRILTTLYAVIAEDDRHAADLRLILEHPWPTPPIIAPRRITA